MTLHIHQTCYQLRMLLDELTDGDAAKRKRAHELVSTVQQEVRELARRAGVE